MKMGVKEHWSQRKSRIVLVSYLRPVPPVSKRVLCATCAKGKSMTTEGPDLFDWTKNVDISSSAFWKIVMERLESDGSSMTIDLDDWILFEVWRHTPAGREISNLVVRYSLQMKRRGWTRFSIEAVINKIRWEQALKDGPDAEGFKVNNNWKRRLAIWAMSIVPDLYGFFRLREERESNAE